MANLSLCPECGAENPVTTSKGVCTKCLFGLGMVPLVPRELDLDLELSGSPGPSPGAKNSASGANEPPLLRLGDYELLEEIARGGMGVVYRARQVSLGRIVAVKLIIAGQFASREQMLRFRAEAESAARLQHPHIVRIHETGEHEGCPYFSMDHVGGGNLTSLVRAGPVSIRQAATLAVTLAKAIHYAHEQGVLHRDLKPSNVLLDEAGQPRITDFGLARRLEKDSFLTVTGQVLGSPNFMPPEQAGAKLKTGRPSDVYALGGILFYLLTGRPPFVAGTVQETLQQVLANDPVSPKLLNSSVPADLATICLKCLEKEPARRYATALELADELDRFLKDEPIRARASGATARLWRSCRRKPALACALAAAAVFLIAGVCGVLWQWRDAQRNATAALHAATLANVETKRAETNERAARRAQYASDINLAYQTVQHGDLFRARQLLERHRPALRVPPLGDPPPDGPKAELLTSPSPTALDFRGWEWNYLWQQSAGDPHSLLGVHTNAVLAVGRVPDDGTLWSAGIDRFVKFWDLKSRKLMGELPHDEPVWGGVASPDGRWFVSVTLGLQGGHTKKNLRLWDLSTRREVSILFTNTWPRWGASIDISPDSKQLAFIDQKDPERLVVCELPSGREVHRFPAQTDLMGAQAVAYSPDGRFLVFSANNAGDLVILNTKDWTESARLIGHTRNVTSIAFSSDRKFLASVADDRTLRLWNLSERHPQGDPIPLSDFSAWVAFSPDSSKVAIVKGTGISVCRVPDLSIARELRWRSKGANAVAFISEHEVVAGGENGSVALFDLSSERPSSARAPIAPGLALFGGAGPAVSVSPDGSHVLGVFTNSTFQVWQTSDLQSPGPLPLPVANFACAAISARAELIAFADQAGNTVLWRPAHRSAIPLGRPQMNDYSRMTFSHDSRQLAFASERKVSVWDVSNRAETHCFDKPATDLTTMWLGFSPDGTALASGNFSGNVRVWRLDRLGQEANFVGHEFQVNGCDFSPDGKTLVTSQGHLCFWDLPGSSLRRKLDDLPGHAVKVCHSPDGSRLAVGFGNGTIVIFDYPEMQELIRLNELDQVYRLAFSADGQTLIAVSRYEIRSWNGARTSSTPLTPTKATTP